MTDSFFLFSDRLLYIGVLSLLLAKALFPDEENVCAEVCCSYSSQHAETRPILHLSFVGL